MSLIGPIKPYFTYAAQMRSSLPIMAYFCKMYAVQTGFGLIKGVQTEQAQEVSNYLKGELSDLETMKAALGGLPKEVMQASVEKLVISIFAEADKDERTCETITKNQAIAFKRSSYFI